MGEELAVRNQAEQQAALEVRAQVNQIQYLMHNVLKQGEHYGTIPGTGKNAKPTLFQSGAEKIAFMFHLVPKCEVTRESLPGGHREYEVKCTLVSRDTGQEMGCGIGLCSTMESKYRYRWTGYGDNRRRVENADIADTYNTVMKMAKKRALVDAVKSTTAASDIFSQDIEDLPKWMVEQAAQEAQEPGQPAVSAGYYEAPQPAPQTAPPRAAQPSEERDDTELIQAYKRMGAAIEAWAASIGGNADNAKAGVKKRPEWEANKHHVGYILSIAREFEENTRPVEEEAEVVEEMPELLPDDIAF